MQFAEGIKPKKTKQLRKETSKTSCKGKDHLLKVLWFYTSSVAHEYQNSYAHNTYIHTHIPEMYIHITLNTNDKEKTLSSRSMNKIHLFLFIRNMCENDVKERLKAKDHLKR